MDNILSVNNVWLAFPKPKNSDEDDLYILNDIVFGVKRGMLLGISGESGSGKTSLAKILAGINKPSLGTITSNFVSAKNRKSYPVQLLFQNNEDIINPYRKVEDVLIEALLIEEKEIKLRTELFELTETLQISTDLLKRRCRQLSGGERQRIALARLLAVKPEVLILDEPFSAQDVESQMNLVTLLRSFKEKGDMTIICISHLTNILKNISDDIIVLSGGRIVAK